MADIHVAVTYQHDKPSITDRLKEWRHWEAERIKLKCKLDTKRERLAILMDKLTEGGIRSSLSVVYDERMTMPHGTDVSDRVGNMVASALDRAQRIKWEVEDLEQELGDVEDKIADILVDISDLSDKHRSVLILKYRDGFTQEAIAGRLQYSQQRVDQMEDEALGALRRAW